jgi:hypothetical protein
MEDSIEGSSSEMKDEQHNRTRWAELTDTDKNELEKEFQELSGYSAIPEHLLVCDDPPDIFKKRAKIFIEVLKALKEERRIYEKLAIENENISLDTDNDKSPITILDFNYQLKPNSSEKKKAILFLRDPKIDRISYRVFFGKIIYENNKRYALEKEKKPSNIPLPEDSPIFLISKK